MQRYIDHMYADVQQAATTSDCLLSEPGTDARDAGASPPVSLRVKHIADIATLNDCTGVLNRRTESLIHADHEYSVRLSCRDSDRIRFVDVHCERFFEQRVFAASQAVDCVLRMKLVGHGDVDRVDVLVCDELS